MTEKLISRKAWHETIDDEMDYALVNLGAETLIKTCVNPGDPPYEITDYEKFCRCIIMKAGLPDEFSYNDTVKILHDYLKDRWEKYNGQSESTI